MSFSHLSGSFLCASEPRVPSTIGPKLVEARPYKINLKAQRTWLLFHPIGTEKMK